MLLHASDFSDVALASMQDTHLEEIAMINAILDMLESVDKGGVHQAMLTAPLNELLEHTREHFADEERLMQAHHFPAYGMHKGAHELFLADLEQVVADWKSGQRLAPLVRFMHQELPAWMKQHIGTMDAATARFIAMQP